MPIEIPTEMCALSTVYKFIRRLFGERRKRWDMARRLIYTSSIAFFQ